MWKKLSLITGLTLVVAILGYQITLVNTWRHQEQAKTEEELEPVVQGADTVTKDTTIIIESYDKDGKRINRTEESGNAIYMGQNRLELLLYANQYREQYASSEEQEEGLERMVLESYSPETVTFVKYYGEPEPEEGYFIGVRDGVVIVYLADRSAVYEYTNIEQKTLPEEVQQELIDGIRVKNEQELFDFLQTYSS